MQDSLQKLDVLDGQLQDLALAQFFIGRMRRKKPPQIRESAAHVLLPEPLAMVREHFPASADDHDAGVGVSNPGRRRRRGVR